jgi:hypothetical protein
MQGSGEILKGQRKLDACKAFAGGSGYATSGFFALFGLADPSDERRLSKEERK